jgi:glutamine synthetase
VCDTFTNHQRILFNGNGYSDAWRQEAQRRGLSDLRTTTDAMPQYATDKNVELVTKHGIFTESEFRARNEIYLEAYRKIINIEAKTTLDMALRQILPAVSRYCGDLARDVAAKKSIGCPCKADADSLEKIAQGVDRLYDLCQTLKSKLVSVPKENIDAANYFSSIIVPAMDAVRAEADVLELLTDKSYWPFPTYSDLLFY